MVQFKFQPFKFDGICQTVALTLCPLMGKFDGIEPICYSRNVEVASLLVFQPGITHTHTQKKSPIAQLNYLVSYVNDGHCSSLYD